ncbi:MAG TPA: response regulator, partial [Polyangiaceae bacterium]|nr:response regulator [Polyangiaceae bacterium]
HQVYGFTSGAEAVDALRNESFEAVITDLEMPQTDGHAVLRVARDCVPAACLVVATARALDKGQELSEAGACMVTDKPMDYDAVVKIIGECRRQGGARARGACPMQSTGRLPVIQIRL